MTGPTCSTGKRIFWTRVDAEEELCNTKSSDNPWRQEKRTYRCPYCTLWHLTSQPRRRVYR